MAIEINAPLVARLLTHIRDRIVEEMARVGEVLPPDVERHRERVFIGPQHKDLVRSLAERMNPGNWEEQPIGPPVCLDGLSDLVGEIQHYIDSLPRDAF